MIDVGMDKLIASSDMKKSQFLSDEAQSQANFLAREILGRGIMESYENDIADVVFNGTGLRNVVLANRNKDRQLKSLEDLK